MEQPRKWVDTEPSFPTSTRHVDARGKPDDVYDANGRHDRSHGDPRKWARIRSAWNPEALMPKVQLTDALIEKRRKQGYFSDEYKAAIRRLVDAKSKKMKEQEKA
jgi:hypothetical protein